MQPIAIARTEIKIANYFFIISVYFGLYSAKGTQIYLPPSFPNFSSRIEKLMLYLYKARRQEWNMATFGDKYWA